VNLLYDLIDHVDYLLSWFVLYYCWYSILNGKNHSFVDYLSQTGLDSRMWESLDDGVDDIDHHRGKFQRYKRLGSNELCLSAEMWLVSYACYLYGVNFYLDLCPDRFYLVQLCKLGCSYMYWEMIV